MQLPFAGNDLAIAVPACEGRARRRRRRRKRGLVFGCELRTRPSTE